MMSLNLAQSSASLAGASLRPRAAPQVARRTLVVRADPIAPKESVIPDDVLSCESAQTCSYFLVDRSETPASDHVGVTSSGSAAACFAWLVEGLVDCSSALPSQRASASLQRNLI